MYDCNEAEAWMSEQELYMMQDERGKDEFSTENRIKKHDRLQVINFLGNCYKSISLFYPSLSMIISESSSL